MPIPLRRLNRCCLLALACLLAVPGLGHGLLHERIEVLTGLLEREPRNAGALAERAELFQAHGLFTEAGADLELLESVQPGNVTNRLRRGLLALAAKETNAAVSELTAWSQTRPDDAAGHYGLARALILAGRPAEAVPHFSRVINLGPAAEARPELFLERARAQVAAGMPVPETLGGLDEGVARLGPLPVLQRFAADLELERGDADAAVARIEAIAARSERKERWWFQEGELYLRAGRTNEARAKFVAARDALDRLPDRLRRAWVATELRQQVESRLAGMPPAPQTFPEK